MKHVNNPENIISTNAPSDLFESKTVNPTEYRLEWLNSIKERSDGRLSQSLLIGSLQAADALIIAMIGTLIFLGYVGPLEFEQSRHYWMMIALAAIIGPICLQISGAYMPTTIATTVSQTVRILAVISCLFLTAMSAIFLLKLGMEFSRIWLVTWTAASGVAICALHLIMRYMMKRWHKLGRLSTRVIVVGGGEPAEQLIKSIQSTPDSFVEVVGLFDDRTDTRSPELIGQLPKLGKVSELAEFARTYGVDMLVITLPLTAENRLLQIMRHLWVLPVDIRLSAHTQRLRYLPRAYSWLGNIPMIDVFDRPLRDWSLVVKTIEDKLIASLAVIAFAPVMIAVAIAIKLESKGPVIFKQVRYGFNNKPINVFKFRSMYTDMCDASASRLVTRDDPRVTRVGKFIRKTSLDELPQFFNVLRGDLSLVGPRPHAHHAKAANLLYDDVVDGYFARHKVKPGITGWAQINGWRGETDTEEKIQRRVEFDLYYIENWSLLFDLQIIAYTPFALLKTDNAY
ncbi:MAG: undecaprenyl-phosphate glucose phosphotransferase [Anderseniella sp.]